MKNNYKVSGKKMTSRFGMSRNAMVAAVKAGYAPSAQEARAYGKPPEYSAKYWRKIQRMSNRQIRTHEKSLPLFDMDGGYYHG